MDKETVLDMLAELRHHGTGDCTIVVEEYTVDGHFVHKRKLNSPSKMAKWVYNQVHKVHKLTLTIK